MTDLKRDEKVKFDMTLTSTTKGILNFNQFAIKNGDKFAKKISWPTHDHESHDHDQMQGHLTIEGHTTVKNIYLKI